MKKIDTSNIIENVRQLGATKVTLDHINTSIKETLNFLLLGLAANPSGVLALYGCVNSGSGLNFNISAGACWYNGELYEVDALTGTAGGGQTAVLSLETTYLGTDPVLYSNNQSYPTHRIDKLKWSFAAPGAAIVDYSGLTRLKERVNVNLLDVAGQISTQAAATLVSANAYADSLVSGLWDDRGNFNASVNAYPSSGGSGVAGAILKGDIWTISVAGTLPTGISVLPGSTVRALVDTPGNTQANWSVQATGIGYVPVNKAGDTMGGILNAGGNKIIGLAAATANGDAVRYEQVAALAIPSGTIVMWGGTVAPTGWALCNGSGGTPDLRSKFIVGYDPTDVDYDAIGDNGGEKAHVLSANEMANHQHSVVDAYFLCESGTSLNAINNQINISPGKHGTNNPGIFGSSTKLMTRNTVTGFEGLNLAHENRPPYYTLAFIQKL